MLLPSIRLLKNKPRLSPGLPYTYPVGFKKKVMKLAIEMEAEDWLELCRLNHQVMEVITANMASNPLAYSTAARLTNEVFNQVCNKIPYDELDRIKAKQEAEED